MVNLPLGSLTICYISKLLQKLPWECSSEHYKGFSTKKSYQYKKYLLSFQIYIHSTRTVAPITVPSSFPLKFSSIPAHNSQIALSLSLSLSQSKAMAASSSHSDVQLLPAPEPESHLSSLVYGQSLLSLSLSIFVTFYDLRKSILTASVYVNYLYCTFFSKFL